jgi:hypothetical protein
MPYQARPIGCTQTVQIVVGMAILTAKTGDGNATSFWFDVFPCVYSACKREIWNYVIIL